MVEHELYAARGAQTSIVFVEVAPDIGYRAVVVICRGFNKNGNAMWTIPFKSYLFEVGCVFVGSFFDGAFHIVLGHVCCPAILQYSPQPRIHFRVCTIPFPNRNDDVLIQASKSLRHSCPTLEFALFPEFKCSSHSSRRSCEYRKILKSCHSHLPNIVRR